MFSWVICILARIKLLVRVAWIYNVVRINSVPALVIANAFLVCFSWVAINMWPCVWLSFLWRVGMWIHMALWHLPYSLAVSHRETFPERQQMLLREGIPVPLFIPFSLSCHSLLSDLVSPCYCLGLDRISAKVCESPLHWSRLYGLYCTCTTALVRVCMRMLARASCSIFLTQRI